MEGLNEIVEPVLANILNYKKLSTKNGRNKISVSLMHDRNPANDSFRSFVMLTDVLNDKDLVSILVDKDKTIDDLKKAKDTLIELILSTDSQLLYLYSLIVGHEGVAALYDDVIEFNG